MGVYGTHLYVLWIPDGELCKIGRSSNCERRLKQIRAYMPWLHVEIAAVFPDGGWVETTMHDAFKSRRCGREWFKVPKDEAIATANMYLSCLNKPRPKMPRKAVKD